MKALLDTNIIIHREASKIVNKDIGQLFLWLDKLKFTKCIHPLTLQELNKNLDPRTVETMSVKLQSYNILQTQAPLHSSLIPIIEKFDINENDKNDSKLVNEVFNDRVDILITEDKKIHQKAKALGISNRIFRIDTFLEKLISENPNLVDYKVLSVRKSLFGNLNLNDTFFDSFREDYLNFNKWFNKKADEIAYTCYYRDELGAFLYLKVEDKNENYSEITPILLPKKRLKIGTFKVTLNGFKIGERFLKIIFDNAIKFKVDEIYVTIFEKSPEQQRLIDLLETFGFEFHGFKNTVNGYGQLEQEQVFVKNFTPHFNVENPCLSFPFISKSKDVYFVSVYPEYHTELFPDSILRTESPGNYVENEPHRNAIRKVYISHSIKRDMKVGDILLFYRTGGLYKGVVTTIAIIESIIPHFNSENDFYQSCKNKTALTQPELKKFWDRNAKNRPFVVNLLYCYSLEHRINLKRLIDLGVIQSVEQMPRGFYKMGWNNLIKVIKDSKSDESIISD